MSKGMVIVMAAALLWWLVIALVLGAWLEVGLAGLGLVLLWQGVVDQS